MTELNPILSYDGDYSEVPGLIKKVGITMDDSLEDREKFQALQQLLALYTHYRLLNMFPPIGALEEDAQEFLVG